MRTMDYFVIIPSYYGCFVHILCAIAIFLCTRDKKYNFFFSPKTKHLLQTKRKLLKYLMNHFSKTNSLFFVNSSLKQQTKINKKNERDFIRFIRFYCKHCNLWKLAILTLTAYSLNHCEKKIHQMRVALWF